jgi:hypothetical protein
MLNFSCADQINGPDKLSLANLAPFLAPFAVKSCSVGRSYLLRYIVIYKLWKKRSVLHNPRQRFRVERRTAHQRTIDLFLRHQS